MESLAPVSFGKMLRAFRQRQRLTQQALADKLEVHRNTIILWEGDKPFPGTKAMVFRIASHLRLSEQETRQLLEASLTEASLKKQGGRTTLVRSL
jgi:transcriptional regulator with XRE-family HTH domain